MMVTYNESVQQSGEWFARIKHATDILEQVTALGEGPFKVNWTLEVTNNRQVYILSLSDWDGSSAIATFSPDELRMRNHMRVRLYQALGDLLQKRNRKQLQELQNTGD